MQYCNTGETTGFSAYSPTAFQGLISAKRRHHHPKILLFRCWGLSNNSAKRSLDSPEEIDDPALKTPFLQEANAINDYDELGYEFYYWRSRAGQEVDFVLYGEKRVLAFEIKRRKRVKSSDCKHLYIFGKDYPIAKRFILYAGEESYSQRHLGHSV